MKTIKGPGIFLAQFVRDEEPYNSMEGLVGWVSGLGYRGVQIPSWESGIFDLDKPPNPRPTATSFGAS